MIKNFDTYIIEELQIGNIKHDFHKHKFKTGDICIYHSDNKELDGKLCKILHGMRQKGESFLQGISDFLHTDHMPEIKFAKSKTNTYAIEFLDVYDNMINLEYDSSGCLKKDSITKTETIKKLGSVPTEFGNSKGVPEYMLELDPVATKKYRDEQEKLRLSNLGIDPYGEDDWSDKNTMRKYKFDFDNEEWIDVKESYKKDYCTWLDEDDEDKIIGFYVADLLRSNIYDFNLKDFLRYVKPRIHKHYKDAYNELMSGFYDDSGTAILALLDDGSSVFVGKEQGKKLKKSKIKLNPKIDPYGEDDWNEEDELVKNYKYNKKVDKFVKENINQDIDPYGEEDWDEREDIFINEDEMGQVFLNITKNHVEFESFLDNQVHDYIVNYITNRLEDINVQDFEEATQETPFTFKVIDENDPWKHSKGYFVLKNGVLKIVRWGD